jgi:hypothetical protein
MTKEDSKVMRVIWRRPDGYHEAHPTDYRVAQIGDCRVWLHKRESEEFPFKVSGDWGAQDQTRGLNYLINRVEESAENFAISLEKTFDHATEADPKKFIVGKLSWVEGLRSNLKGDTWEVEVMDHVLVAISSRIRQAEPFFLKRIS